MPIVLDELAEKDTTIKRHRRVSKKKAVKIQGSDDDNIESDKEKHSPIPAPPASRLVDDIIEPHAAGRTPDEFMDSVVAYCRDPLRMEDVDGSPRVWIRCNGSDKRFPAKRCSKVWALPRAKRRIAEHVCKCPLQSDEAKAEAESWMSKKAPGAKIVERKSRTTAPMTSSSSSKSPAATIPQLFSKQLNESYQEDVEAALVKVVCGLAIPPYATDSKWWHDFMAITSCGQYHPVSGTTLVESLIANEAAFVRQQTISYLQSSHVRHITWVMCTPAEGRATNQDTRHHPSPGITVFPVQLTIELEFLTWQD